MAQNNFWFEQKTVNGYLAHEVASAMQKAIRRSVPDESMYWASELFLSNLDGYCWKRLEIIMVEDVDIFQAGLFADIHALRMTALAARKERKESRPDERESLCLMAAVTRLAVAHKSRVNCNATVVHCQMPRTEGWTYDIPDYALDRHTVKGKQKGRDWNHFLDEAAEIRTVEGEVISEKDPYVETVREYLNNRKAIEAAKAKDDGKLF